MSNLETPKQIAGHFHAVRFYESHESLCRLVADFLGEGVATGQPALVIATPEHNLGIMTELRARHFDIDRMLEAGDLLTIDAHDALARFMVDGLPNADLFNEFAAEMLERSCKGRKDCTIRAYGEMVDVLWKDGVSVAAVKLEMLWNQLAMTHDFSLLCGYAMGNFYKGAGMEEVSEQHSHIAAPGGEFALVEARPAIN